MLQWRKGRAQQAHEADLTIEILCEGIFGFEAYCTQFGHTAQAARRLAVRWPHREVKSGVFSEDSNIQTAQSAGGKIMIELEGEIIVGILGQWASGKTAAARTLIRYLGGAGEVVFITDRDLFASQAVNHILELEDSKVVVSIEDDGRQRLDGEHATVWLDPGEDLKSVDLSTLYRFNVHDDVLPAWLNRARVELGYQICERSAHGKPIVIEAGFGKNPFDHTISDLFMRLEEAGVEPKQVKWIIIEAGYDKRSERNQKRRDTVPVDVFARYAADGGDLDPDHQKRLEEQGTIIKRVPNDHDDIERFRADMIAAFEEMF
jgi:hypothetical protein